MSKARFDIAMGSSADARELVQRAVWISRCETQLQAARPQLSAAAAVAYAMAAHRGLGHESPEAMAERMAACLPNRSATGTAPQPRAKPPASTL